MPSDPSQFTTKSLSNVNLAPYAVFAKLAFPPCTRAEKPTYATVQMGRNEHLNLNSDLVYINHSCDPSLIFDISSQNIIAGHRGLKVGEELTFFYPSTEWDMDQGFDCFCGSKVCLGYIGGAKHMKSSQLEGRFLNAHIRELLEERDNFSKAALDGESLAGNAKAATASTNGHIHTKDATAEALKASLEQACKTVEAAQKALDTYISIHSDGIGSIELGGEMGGDTRCGVTSRELSGEMGGDTVVPV